ncbi:hypothetical protein GCM10018987_41230 [Streptomyces cremeus]
MDHWVATSTQLPPLSLYDDLNQWSAWTASVIGGPFRTPCLRARFGLLSMLEAVARRGESAALADAGRRVSLLNKRADHLT